MKVLGVIMRAYSYLFHLLLALLLIALALVELSDGVHNLNLRMMPWKGATLTYALLAMGVVGSLATILAFKGLLRLVFFLWALFVAGFMIKGYIFSAYIFAGAADFWRTMAFIFAGLVAVGGAYSVWRQQPVRR